MREPSGGGFRPASEVLRICPWRSPQVVVVLVEGPRGQRLCWAQGVGEKRAILRLAGEEDRVVAGIEFHIDITPTRLQVTA